MILFFTHVIYNIAICHPVSGGRHGGEASEHDIVVEIEAHHEDDEDEEEEVSHLIMIPFNAHVDPYIKTLLFPLSSSIGWAP